MSFGFAIGDFISVGELTWTLYRKCYLVARGAPQEFQDLLREIAMLSSAVMLLQKEVQNPQSILVRSGGDRVRMVYETMGRLEGTLKELEKFADRYGKLVDVAVSKRKQWWYKFKWSIEVPDLDSLRNKVPTRQATLGEVRANES